MVDIRVQPELLRATATRVERSLELIESSRQRLYEALLPPLSDPCALLRRAHDELSADRQVALRALADTLRDDVHRLRETADRYEDAERQSTTETP
jgi:uncharacterized protein YukE